MRIVAPGQAEYMHEPATEPAPGVILTVLGAGVVAASSGAILGRLALESGASALATAGYRVGIAALIVAPFAVGQRLRSQRQRLAVGHASEPSMLLGAGLVAGVALALHFGLWIASLAWTTVSSSVALVTSHPFIVAAASPLLIGERPTRGVMTGVSLAAIGVLVIAIGDGLWQSEQVRGDLLALGGAAAFAAYVIVGRRARATVPLVQYVAVVYTVAAIGLLVTAFLAGHALRDFPPAVWGLFIAAALIPQLIGHSSFNWALSHVSATYVSGVTLAEVLGSSVLAWWVFNERPPGRTLIGAMLIGIGLVAASQSERRRIATRRDTRG